VTGGSGAIGHVIAEALGGQQARVAVHYRHNEEAAESCVAAIVQAGGDAKAFHADVTSLGAIATLVQQIESHWQQPIGILVNNAGVFRPNDALETLTEDLYYEMLDANFKSCVFLSQAVVPCMRQLRAGAIVNVASDAGFTGGARGVAIYSAAKAAMLNFTKNLAKELAGTGIRVNATAPGAISGTPSDRVKPPSVRDMLKAQTPLQREGVPSDVADSVLFLVSDLASFITGEALVVSGGLQMR
jgi:3-oxoacyl-[acyl-carrier protein] reductase